MGNETNNMIEAATNNDGAAFKVAFDAAINQKIGDSLDVQRQDIAQNVFGNIRVPVKEFRSNRRNRPVASVVANRKLFATDKASGKLTFFKFPRDDSPGMSTDYSGSFQLRVVEKVKGLQGRGPVVGPTTNSKRERVIAVKIGDDPKTRAEVIKFAKSLKGTIAPQ